MKRFLVTVLCLVMAMSFAACSNKNEQAAGDGDFVKLKYYMFGSQNQLQGAKEVYEGDEEL